MSHPNSANTTDGRWLCANCGEPHDTNDRPCRHCNCERFAFLEETKQQQERRHGKSATEQDQPTDAEADQTAYFIGVALGFVLLIFAPYAVIFIAIPESIAKMFGTSIQTNFPGGARTNDYIEGVMLVMGWFGNFIIFVVALAILAIVAIMALGML